MLNDIYQTIKLICIIYYVENTYLLVFLRSVIGKKFITALPF